MRHNALVVFCQGHITVNRLLGNHHPRRMGRGVAGHPLQLAGGVQQRMDPRVAFIQVSQVLGNRQRFVQGDFQLSGHHFGHSVHLGVAHVQRPAHVPQGGLGRHSAKGNDLSHPVRAVFFHHIINDLLPPDAAEIHVDIRHGNPLRVEKPLEIQVVFHRVDIRDSQAIGNHAAGCAAPARPHRNIPGAGEADKIRHNEKIIGKPHLINHIQLILKPLPIFCRPLGVKPSEPLIRQTLQIFLGVLSVGRIKGGQMLLIKIKFHIAPAGDSRRVAQSARKLILWEKGRHLVGAFQVKFVSFKTHPVLVFHRLAHLNAHQHVLNPGVLPPQIVRVVGGDQTQTQLLSQPDQALIDHFLIRQAVVLHFQVIMIRAKKRLVILRDFFGALIIALAQQLRNLPSQAGRKAN